MKLTRLILLASQDYIPNADWWVWIQRLSPLFTIIGVLIGVFGTDYMARKREKHKQEEDNKKYKESEEKNKNIKLNAAMIALENSRIILLALKHDFIKPYKTQIGYYLKSRNHAEEFKYGSYDMIIKDQSHPKLNNFLYDKILDFIALQRSPYLIAFSDLQVSLDLVNEVVNKRSEFLKESHTLHSIACYINTHESFCSSLMEVVDTCLAYIVLCKKYLNEYVFTFMPGIQLSAVSLQTNYESDMPAEDLLSSIDEHIQQAVIK